MKDVIFFLLASTTLIVLLAIAHNTGYKDGRMVGQKEATSRYEYTRRTAWNTCTDQSTVRVTSNECLYVESFFDCLLRNGY